MPADRDRFIDLFKGLLILWVIHIHTVFWTGEEYLPDVSRQVSLLADVTAFVFISGYLNRSVNFAKSLRRSLKQFINLYLNYLIVSALLLFGLFFALALKQNAFPNFWPAFTSMLKVNPDGKLWSRIPVYPGSLWYIAVYLSTLTLIPIALSLANSRVKRAIVLAATLLLFGIFRYTAWEQSIFLADASYIYLFLFVFMLGVTVRAEERAIATWTLIATFSFNLTLAFGIFFYLQGGDLQIQSHKFPPTFEYLIYSLLPIHLFLIAKRSWNSLNIDSSHRSLTFLEWCGKNVFFIYLFQGIVCSLPYYFLPLMIDRLPAPVTYTTILVFNLVLTLTVTWLYLHAMRPALNAVKSVTDISILKTDVRP